MKQTSIFFIGKKNDYCCERAIEFIRLNFPKNDILTGKKGDRFPENARWWRGDYIISYLSPWVVPKHLLDKAKKASINFHPGPPEYPGVGCTNFAIYNNENSFGVTCHKMNPEVDTGEIITVRRFPLYETDTVYSLTQRCYGHMLSLFYDIMAIVLEDAELPQSKEPWRRKPFRRKELDDLCRITTDMSDDEVQRRIKAVTFPGAPGANIEIGGVNFKT